MALVSPMTCYGTALAEHLRRAMLAHSDEGVRAYASHSFPPTKRRGEVAEAAFLHKAASLGFSVAKPWGESDRYDFIVDVAGRCWRVQVKSAHSSAVNGYSFHACGNVHKKRYTPRDIDFIVGYVVPDDVWYVIPIQEFAEKTTVKVFPSSKRRMSRYEKYRDAWGYFRPEQ